ncbi:hypothetical protein CN192_22305 [Sinorhizobium medicae]|nr:hypothetical protein CN192_22305 [Sinorhizobium medicae]
MGRQHLNPADRPPVGRKGAATAGSNWSISAGRPLIFRGPRGTVRNSVRWAMMMKRRESSHGYRERTSGPAPGGT